MPIKNRFKTAIPVKDYTHMRTLALKLNGIFPEYEFSPQSNGFEIDVRSKELRYKRVKLQRYRAQSSHETNYRLAIPEKGRFFDCGRLPELQNLEILKKALKFEIKAIDGSW